MPFGTQGRDLLVQELKTANSKLEIERNKKPGGRFDDNDLKVYENSKFADNIDIVNLKSKMIVDKDVKEKLFDYLLTINRKSIEQNKGFITFIGESIIKGFKYTNETIFIKIDGLGDCEYVGFVDVSGNFKGFGNLRNTTNDFIYEGDWDGYNLVGNLYANKSAKSKGFITNNVYTVYKGEWKKFKLGGDCEIFYHVDNDIVSYLGEWNQGYKNGQGTLNAFGISFSGTWENGFLKDITDDELKNENDDSMDDSIIVTFTEKNTNKSTGEQKDIDVERKYKSWEEITKPENNIPGIYYRKLYSGGSFYNGMMIKNPQGRLEQHGLGLYTRDGTIHKGLFFHDHLFYDDYYATTNTKRKIEDEPSVNVLPPPQPNFTHPDVSLGGKRKRTKCIKPRKTKKRRRHYSKKRF